MQVFQKALFIKWRVAGWDPSASIYTAEALSKYISSDWRETKIRVRPEAKSSNSHELNCLAGSFILFCTHPTPLCIEEMSVMSQRFGSHACNIASSSLLFSSLLFSSLLFSSLLFSSLLFSSLLFSSLLFSSLLFSSLLFSSVTALISSMCCGIMKCDWLLMVSTRSVMIGLIRGICLQ